MKKLVLYMLAFVIISCSSDDNDLPTMNENSISFTLNGVAYSLTEYSVMLSPIDTNDRVIEATFDNDTKTLVFFVLVEETNQIDEFILIENGVQFSSDPTYGDRETSITTHTDSKMEGTFRVTMNDRNDKPTFVFKDGIIDITY